jgi:hypothetical protein
MLEIERLMEITFNNFEKAIADTVSNKIFVRNNIVEMPNLTKDEQLYIMHNIYFTKSSHILIKTVNNIEWTPTQLYLTGYYIVNLHDKFWLISHNTHEGFVVKYKITHHKYIDILFEAAYNLNVGYLPLIYRCFKKDISNEIKNMKEHIMFIKQMSFVNSTILLDHYLYKKDNKIYYFQFSNTSVYKPFIYT